MTLFPPSFQDCLTLGWPKLLARQRGASTQKGRGSVAGNSGNWAPQLKATNRPSAACGEPLPASPRRAWRPAAEGSQRGTQAFVLAEEEPADGTALLA